MIFLSLGAGVQSTVMLMMAIKGEIERPDHVIFADTGFEPRKVYTHVQWCRKQCEKAWIPMHIVKATENMREDFHKFESGEKRNFNNRPPFYVQGKRGAAQTVRQCTRDAKIIPIKRKQLELMGHKTIRTCEDGEAITMIGISTDEARRAGPSQDRWQDRDYPLIDPLKMSRADCQSWWEQNYPHINLPSSSCTICPFKTNKMWLQMKTDAPEDWSEALEYDERFRNAYKNRLRGRKEEGQEFYIHNSFTPLKDVDLNEGQMGFDLEDEIYCAGGCGL